MGHGIKEYDKGYTKGTTWHNMPQYVQLERAVTLEEALQVFEYEQYIVKAPNLACIGEGEENLIDANSYSIVRTDKKVTLNGAVGGQYTTMNMGEITKLAYGQVVEAFNDDNTEVEIETVGTLVNGATQFVSISFGQHYIHGDDSSTKQRLMVTQDYRGKGIKTLLSTIRTVCANTRAWAIEQARAAGNIHTTRHTKNCEAEVKSIVLDMAAMQYDMLQQKEMLDNLARHGSIKPAQIEAVLDAIYPVAEDAQREPRNKGKREAIKDCFYGGQDGLSGKYATTPYAFYQAITNKVCREKGRANNSADWDNITGRRADIKEAALQKLVEVCV